MHLLFLLAPHALVLHGGVFSLESRWTRARAGHVVGAVAPEDALLALSLPTAPNIGLQPADVVRALCRGLQFNDVPSADAGLSRLFGFATYECRASLTARKGKDSTERFIT